MSPTELLPSCITSSISCCTLLLKYFSSVVTFPFSLVSSSFFSSSSFLRFSFFSSSSFLSFSIFSSFSFSSLSSFSSFSLSSFLSLPFLTLCCFSSFSLVSLSSFSSCICCTILLFYFQFCLFDPISHNFRINFKISICFFIFII